MRKPTLIVLLLLILASAIVTTPAVAGMQYEYASVGISPAYQEIEQGGTTALTVVGQSTLGGSVFVNIPADLDLIGDPACSSGCRTPFVSDQVDGTRIDFTIDGEIATVSFTVAVAPSTPAGTVLSVTAYLVGGPEAVEMSSAMIGVVEVAPIPPPREAQQPSEDSVGDNRQVYLDVSPVNVRISPGGETLYHVQPVRWGMWEDQSPRIDMTITVPEGFTVSSGPWCGRGDVVPEGQPCGESIPTQASDGKEWRINPGYNVSDGAANGVYMILRADNDLEHDTSHRVSVSASVDDDSLAEQPAEVVANILTVGPASLYTPQSGSESVGAVLEFTDGFTSLGLTCSTGESPSQVGLWEVGLVTMFSATSPGLGILGVATDGSGAEVCFMPVLFTDVPPRDLYMLATYDGMDFPCRACIYGTVTSTRGAEAVFPVRW